MIMPTISIGICVDNAEEMDVVAALLKQLLSGKSLTPAVENTPDAQEAAAVEETAAAVVESTTEPDPEPAPEEKPAPQVTLETVRAKLSGLMRSGKQADVKKLLSDFGVDKLTAIPAERFGEVMAAAEAI